MGVEDLTGKLEMVMMNGRVRGMDPSDGRRMKRRRRDSMKLT